MMSAPLKTFIAMVRPFIKDVKEDNVFLSTFKANEKVKSKEVKGNEGEKSKEGECEDIDGPHLNNSNINKVLKREFQAVGLCAPTFSLFRKSTVSSAVSKYDTINPYFRYLQTY